MAFQPVSELKLPVLDWLWPGYLVVGNLAVLDGDPGVGKSLLTIDLGATVTTGRDWPDGKACHTPAPVLFLCDEDSESVIKPRLEAAGADLRRTVIWPRDELPSFPRDTHLLDRELADAGAKLVIIDPIMAFLDRHVDVNTDASVRRALRPIADVANRHRCVILMVRHLNKREGATALYRGGGSIAFVAACRLAWLAARDPRIPGRFVLAQTKNNYAVKQPSLEYEVPRDAARIKWRGPSAWTAADLAVRRRGGRARERACEFLQGFLATGPRLAPEVWSGAARLRLSESTIRRAKDDLNIRCERIMSQGHRYDYWLTEDQEAPDGLSDTPDADAILRRLSQQWAEQDAADQNAADDCDSAGEHDKTD